MPMSSQKAEKWRILKIETNISNELQGCLWKIWTF